MNQTEAKGLMKGSTTHAGHGERAVCRPIFQRATNPLNPQGKGWQWDSYATGDKARVTTHRMEQA